MKKFENQLEALLEELDTTLYQVALSIGEDPSRIGKVLYKKRPTSFDKRLETLALISKSPLLDGRANLDLMSAWLAAEYLTEESFERLLNIRSKKKVRRMK